MTELSVRFRSPRSLLTYVVAALGLHWVDGTGHPVSSQPNGLNGNSASTKPLASQDHSVIKEVLSAVLSWQEDRDRQQKTLFRGDGGVGSHNARPFITLAYAQSLDGMIGLHLPDVVEDESGDVDAICRIKRPGVRSSNLPLSGTESLILTHALRSIHDAVLVGGSTLSTDNPQLSNRLWKRGGENPSRLRQPRPVVLDTELRHLKMVAGEMMAVGAIVCCSLEAAEAATSDFCPSLTEIDGNVPRLVLLPCKRDPAGQGLDLVDVMRKLYNLHGIRSVMVEGGSAVLSAFATATAQHPVSVMGRGEGFLDCICITISPKLIGGKRGIPAFQNLDLNRGEQDGRALVKLIDFDKENFQFFKTLGADCIYLAQWPSN